MVDFSLILPVHNEEAIIGPVLKDILAVVKRTVSSYECILVENGSTDGTFGVVTALSKRYAHVRVARAPKGYGSAVLAGLAGARGRYVCYMPSDGQIDLRVIPTLWRLIQTGDWDVVKVRRATRESWDRWMTSAVFSWIVSMVFGIPRYDVNGSPRILLRSDMMKLRLHYTDSFNDTEFAVKATALGWNIQEIPMRTLPRRGGMSTRSWRTYWEFIKNLYTFRRQEARIILLTGLGCILVWYGYKILPIKH